MDIKRDLGDLVPNYLENLWHMASFIGALSAVDSRTTVSRQRFVPSWTAVRPYCQRFRGIWIYV